MKGVIFDLDQTLVDTSAAEVCRKRRDWHMANVLIVTQGHLYDGMREVFKYIRQHGLRVGIVSTAPRSYVQFVVDYFNIPYNCIVGYYDAKPIKPDPEPMFKALYRLGLDASEVIAFGDRLIDIEASQRAGILSVACYWGTKESDLLACSRADASIYSPVDIMRVLGDHEFD